MKYFAYGSNCNPAVMDRKGVVYTSRHRAALPGYRVLFNKRAMRQRLPVDIGFANVNPHEGGRVEGILYDIPDEYIDRLDESERVPEHYRRIDVTVETDDGPEPCFTYQALPDKIAEGLRPSRNYLNHILSARDFLSRQYYDALDKSKTYEAECAVCRKVTEIIFVRDGDDLHMLCQPCREARIIWGDTRGRKLTVPEAEAIMTHVVRSGEGFASIRELVDAAIDAKIIDP